MKIRLSLDKIRKKFHLMDEFLYEFFNKNVEK